MPEKCILVLLDGIGDRSFEELNNKTPLQAARTPFLDSVAARGSSGLFHASLQGEALPSERAHFAMFGYDLSEFPGRGLLEALGAGIEVAHGDVALLGHIAGVQERDGSLIVVREKERLPENEASLITGAIGSFNHDGIRIDFIPTDNLFGIVRMRGEVSPKVTDTNLMLEGLAVPEPLPLKDAAQDERAVRTAAALRAYLCRVYRMLERHPLNEERRRNGEPALNFLVTQRAGQLRTVEPVGERYGLRCLSIASGIVYHGLCRYLGFDIQKASDSSDPQNDIAVRLRSAVEQIDRYDFIHVHTKAADEAAHRKDPVLKKQVIESLDRGLQQGLSRVLENPSVLVMVTADHSTPSCGRMIHSGEPVPLTLCGRWVRRDTVHAFDEISAAGGSLGFVRGPELMCMVLNYLDRGKLKGIMDTPEDRPYFPGTCRPFKPER